MKRLARHHPSQRTALGRQIRELAGLGPEVIFPLTSRCCASVSWASILEAPGTEEGTMGESLRCWHRGALAFQAELGSGRGSPLVHPIPAHPSMPSCSGNQVARQPHHPNSFAVLRNVLLTPLSSAQPRMRQPTHTALSQLVIGHWSLSHTALSHCLSVSAKAHTASEKGTAHQRPAFSDQGASLVGCTEAPLVLHSRPLVDHHRRRGFPPLASWASEAVQTPSPSRCRAPALRGSPLVYQPQTHSPPRRSFCAHVGSGSGGRCGSVAVHDPPESLPYTVKGLNHIALAVPKLAEAAEHYRTVFGASVSDPMNLPEHGVSVVFVHLGTVTIELLEPLGDNSTIAKFLAKNPKGGLHHLCFTVDDIHGACRHVADEGVRVLGWRDPSKGMKEGGAEAIDSAGEQSKSSIPEPKIGAHGNPVIFLDPRDNLGVLCEFEQVH